MNEHERTARARIGRGGEGDSSRPQGLPTLSFGGTSSGPSERPRRLPPEPTPEKIGAFRILGVLGWGGMGVVYLAEQHNPLREVALKVMTPGLVAPEHRRRFDQEARILGRLQHPGIAQIYEAGIAETDGGPRPFLLMERIEGVPLTEFARIHKLSIRQRLEVLARVANAVHYAHQRGIIHRDLKPANILLTADGLPKILDFGVAHVIDDDARIKLIVTAPGQPLGTLPYMSPEQVGGHPDDLDIRSDVYALGIILFELLAGHLPHDLSGMSLAQAARVVAETEAPRLGRLNKWLRGDIEHIVARALERTPDDRYPSADALAADIHRHLASEPIVAGPQSWWKQTVKFGYRHKALVGGVAGAVFVLAAAVVLLQSQIMETKRESARAQKAEADARLEVRNGQWLLAQYELAVSAADSGAAHSRKIERLSHVLELMKDIGRNNEPEAVFALMGRAFLLEEQNDPAAIDDLREGIRIGWPLFEDRGNVSLFGGVRVFVPLGEKAASTELDLAFVLRLMLDRYIRFIQLDNDHSHDVLVAMERRALCSESTGVSSDAYDDMIEYAEELRELSHNDAAIVAFERALLSFLNMHGDGPWDGFSDRIVRIAVGLGQCGQTAKAAELLALADREEDCVYLERVLQARIKLALASQRPASAIQSIVQELDCCLESDESRLSGDIGRYHGAEYQLTVTQRERAKLASILGNYQEAEAKLRAAFQLAAAQVQITAMRDVLGGCPGRS